MDDAALRLRCHPGADGPVRRERGPPPRPAVAATATSCALWLSGCTLESHIAALVAPAPGEPGSAPAARTAPHQRTAATDSDQIRAASSTSCSPTTSAGMNRTT